MNKKYTQTRGAKKEIVLNGDRWVFVQRFDLTPDLQGDHSTFLINIRDKDFYFEDVLFTSHNKDEVETKRHHGPYPIELVFVSDYVFVEIDELKRFIEDTLQNEEFNNGFPFSEQFRLEAEELVFSVLRPDSEIFWLNKSFAYSSNLSGRYGYWAEVVIRNKNDGELAYITFSED